MLQYFQIKSPNNFKQKKQYGEVVSPIYLTTTFKQKEPGIPFNKYEYSRSGNPTRDELETCIANLENSAYGISFSSGLATINAVLKIIEKDKILLSVLDIYGGTKRLFSKLHNNINQTMNEWMCYLILIIIALLIIKCPQTLQE